MITRERSHTNDDEKSPEKLHSFLLQVVIVTPMQDIKHLDSRYQVGEHHASRIDKESTHHSCPNSNINRSYSK